MSNLRPPLRVFLAEDHVVLRDALKLVLEQRGYEVVGEASDGRTAITLCQDLRPQVAILDIGMPLLNGIDAAQEILRGSPETKIILLTMHAEHPFVAAALRAGIAGYVLKSSAASQLVLAIETVLAGEQYLSPGVLRLIVDTYVSQDLGRADPLTAREREVLQLLVGGKNVKEIGSLLGISGRTAESHRARLMAKLKIDNIADLVRYAFRNGIADLDAPDMSRTA